MSNDVFWLGAGCLALVELVSGAAITRACLRTTVCIVGTIELGSMRLMRMLCPPRYEVVRSCHKCGSCCTQIVSNPPSLIKRTVLINAYLFAHKLLHNFDVVGRGPDDEVLFSCAHLRSDGRCRIYARRPFMCRNYPVRPFFRQPQLLPGCGYGIASKAVARMRRRACLPIVNPGVTVHHPTRDHDGLDLASDFEWFNDSDGKS